MVEADCGTRLVLAVVVMCLQVGMLEKLAAGVVQVERRKAAFGRQRTPEFYLGMGGSSADHHVVS